MPEHRLKKTREAYDGECVHPMKDRVNKMSISNGFLCKKCGKVVLNRPHNPAFKE